MVAKSMLVKPIERKRRDVDIEIASYDNAAQNVGGSSRLS